MRLRVIISKSEGELQLLLSVLKRSERHGFNYLNPKQNVHHCVVVVTYDQDNLCLSRKDTPEGEIGRLRPSSWRSPE